MSSSPLHNNPNILASSSSSSFGMQTTKERTNTSDSNNSNNLAILSPSYSKDEDYDSIADDSQEVNEFQQHDHDDEQQQHHNNNGEEEEEDNLMGSGMLILEALAPGESSSPIRGGTSTATVKNKVIVAGRKYDLCGSMYKRRGGFGRNKENNWYDYSLFFDSSPLRY